MYYNVSIYLACYTIILSFSAANAFTNKMSHKLSSLTLYEKLLRKIYFIENPKRGLQNMIELNHALGKPLDDPRISVIHVAGTNGKGSVCLKIARSLELAGHNVGLLISPHISCYRERMSINGELISEKQVEEYLPQILDICETHGIKATFFEITTGLAFRYFADCGADVVVLETGLGGLLDATNVVSGPVLSIITSIGLEHTAILGDTIELIGEQKAGIIKKNCPVLVGPNVPHETIRRCAVEREAEGYYTCEDVLNSTALAQEVNVESMCHHGGIEYVDYDVQNSSIAKAALTLLRQKRMTLKFPSSNLTDEIIAKGISQRPACRFEEIKTEGMMAILDIAHNPPAMRTLVAKLEATYPNKKKRFVVGFSADKDIAEIGNLLLSVVPHPNHIHLVEAVNLRAAKVEDITSVVPRLADSYSMSHQDRSITGQVQIAMKIAAENDEILVVCGSVFLMSEARYALGIEEERDSDNITAVAGKGLLNCKEKLLLEKK
jgi:dihydrofolate synthase/folylpolyglutamate synthase